MDDDKFGVCGILWLISIALFCAVFKALRFPLWLTVVLSWIGSLVVFTAIYLKWTTGWRSSSMINVGVFWVISLLSVDIIYDIEEYPEDYKDEDMLLTYSKQHKDVWEKLSKEQYSGKYSGYKFDTFPRGRVWYDLEEKYYKIVFYRGSKEFVNTIAPKIKELFGIDEAEITRDCIEQ